MTIRIPSRAAAALALAGATLLAAGCGGTARATPPAATDVGGIYGTPTRHAGAVELGAAATPGGSVARCQGMPRREPEAGRLATGQVRLTRTATVSFGAPAGTPVRPVAPVPCASPGPRAGVGLCPPGFWRLYRLSVSAGHHPPALFPFPSGCGIAGKAGTFAGPAATPMPLATSPG